MTGNTIVIKMRFANNFNGMKNTKCSQIYKMCVYTCQNNMLISMTNNWKCNVEGGKKNCAGL